MPLGRIQFISFDRVDAATLAKLLKMDKCGIDNYIDSVISAMDLYRTLK